MKPDWFFRPRAHWSTAAAFETAAGLAVAVARPVYHLAKQRCRLCPRNLGGSSPSADPRPRAQRQLLARAATPQRRRAARPQPAAHRCPDGISKSICRCSRCISVPSARVAICRLGARGRGNQCVLGRGRRRPHAGRPRPAQRCWLARPFLTGRQRAVAGLLNFGPHRSSHLCQRSIGLVPATCGA